MKVDEYHLHCSGCEPSQWILVPAKKVHVTVDLAADSYEFRTTCPYCKNNIRNSRTAFR